MSGCDRARVEALLHGELGESEAAKMSSHLVACDACAGEANALRIERRTFQARAAEPFLALPAFDDVLAAAELPRKLPVRRAATAVFAAAMSLAAALLLAIHLPVGGVAEAANGGACFSPDGEGETIELAQATEDARFNECLVASPDTRNRCF